MPGEPPRSDPLPEPGSAPGDEPQERPSVLAVTVLAAAPFVLLLLLWGIDRLLG